MSSPVTALFDRESFHLDPRAVLRDMWDAYELFYKLRRQFKGLESKLAETNVTDRETWEEAIRAIEAFLVCVDEVCTTIELASVTVQVRTELSELDPWDDYPSYAAWTRELAKRTRTRAKGQKKALMLQEDVTMLNAVAGFKLPKKHPDVEARTEPVPDEAFMQDFWTILSSIEESLRIFISALQEVAQHFNDERLGEMQEAGIIP